MYQSALPKNYALARFAWRRVDLALPVSVGRCLGAAERLGYKKGINHNDVYYTGTEERWAEITIGPSNNELTNATIHYNYVSTEE